MKNADGLTRQKVAIAWVICTEQFDSNSSGTKIKSLTHAKGMPVSLEHSPITSEAEVKIRSSRVYFTGVSGILESKPWLV